MYLSAVVGFTSTAVLWSKHWTNVFSVDSIPIADTVRSGGGGGGLIHSLLVTLSGQGVRGDINHVTVIWRA